MLNWFTDLVGHNGSLSVFIGGLLEEIIIPIPSPLVSITAGALLIKEASFLPALGQIVSCISLPFSVGALIGTNLAYFLAFFGGKLMIEKTEKFLGFSWKVVEKTQQKYFKGSGDELAIVILRAIPVVPVSLVSIICGGLRYNLKSFYFASFIGLLIRSTILGIIGWQTGHTYENWIHGLDKIETVVSLIILILLAAVLFIMYRQREKFFKKSA